MDDAVSLAQATYLVQLLPFQLRHAKDLHKDAQLVSLLFFSAKDAVLLMTAHPTGRQVEMLLCLFGILIARRWREKDRCAVEQLD